MATRHYRLRIRNAADDGDELVVSSVPDDTYPHLAGVPTGDGQEMDPLTGETIEGLYTVELVDVDLGGGTRVLTQKLTDGQGRQQLLQRRAYIEMSADVGSSWPTVLTAGYVSAYRLITAQRWSVSVGDSRRIDLVREVFKEVTPNFGKVTQIIGGPIRGGWMSMADYGPWVCRVASVQASAWVTLEFDWGIVPVAEDTGLYTLSFALPAYARDRANRLAEPERVLALASSGYPGIDIEVRAMDGTLQGTFKAISFMGAQFINPGNQFLINWQTSQPDIDDRFQVYAWRRTICAENPLHIEGHPVDIMTDLWDEAGIPYNNASVAAMRVLLGPDMLMGLRITEGMKLAEAAAGIVFGPCGIAQRTNASGERELFSTRVRTASPPAATIVLAELRSKDTTVFDVDEATVANTVVFRELEFFRWMGGGGERPPDETVAVPLTKSFDYASGGATPDSDTYGLREVTYTIPGKVYGGAAPPAGGTDWWERGIAMEVFDRYGRGAIHTEIACLPSVDDLIGDEVTLQLAHLPTENVRGSNRTAQILKRTETPNGPVLRLLDAGTNAQFTPAPTFSLAAGADDARKYVDVTITNYAALNAANAWLRVEWGFGAGEPAGGTMLTYFLEGEIPDEFTTPAVDAGTKVWMRMQAYQPFRRPSAVTAWQSQDLTDLVAPSSLSQAADPENDAIRIVSFTNSEADIPLEVYLNETGDDPRLVQHLPAGSVKTAPLFLEISTEYTVGIRHKEVPPFNGVSPLGEIEFTPTGDVVTLAAPSHPTAFGGEVVA